MCAIQLCVSVRTGTCVGAGNIVTDLFTSSVITVFTLIYIRTSHQIAIEIEASPAGTVVPARQIVTLVLTTSITHFTFVHI